MNSSVLRASESPQRSGDSSMVRGSSIIPPRVQTSAAHARRYEGAFGVQESGVSGSHVSRAAIADGLDSRNTQARQCQLMFVIANYDIPVQVLEHVLQQLGALTDMMSIVQQRMQVSANVIRLPTFFDDPRRSRKIASTLLKDAAALKRTPIRVLAIGSLLAMHFSASQRALLVCRTLVRTCICKFSN